MLKEILSISGKPGLYKLINNTANALIVESLLDGKRFPAYSNAKIIALEDISIYTEDEDMPLKTVFKRMYEKEEGKPAINHKESADVITDYIKSVIPEYDAEIITESKHMADLFEATTAICNKPKKVSNWLMVETMRLMKEHSMEAEDLKFSPVNLAKLIELNDAGTVNSSVAKEVFEQIFLNDIEPDVYVEEHGLKTVNDADALRTTLEKVIADNPQAVADYRGGKEKALGALF